MRSIFIAVLILVCTGCARQIETVTIPSAGQQAVAMPDTFSADAAMAVLAEGGNAVDAAITAQFVLAVTYPEAGNIGGGGFMTLSINGQADFLDYREMAPGAAHRDMYLDEQGHVHPYESLFGAKASGVPGTVAGMWEAHQKYGSLPWSRLVQPAVDLAEQGFVVPEHLAGRISRYLARVQKQGLFSNFGDYFAHATANSVFSQPELAETLKRIRDQGRNGFYDGETARIISSYMQQNGGLITAQDLASYEAKWRTPITHTWRGYTVITAPPPSSGGVAVVQWLGMMEPWLESLPEHNSSQYIHLLSEVGKRVFADRAEYLGDPDFVEVPVQALTEPAYLAKRSSEVNPDAISVTEDIAPGLYESEDTTHFSIVDRWGNAVANTTTINLSFGAGVVVSGAGFLLNDEMDDFSAKAGVPNFFGAIGGTANEIQPFKRMLSSMTPTIVLKGRDVALVTGSPGGTTIISSVTQSVLNTLVYDMTAQAAADAPRVHHQLWPKDTIRHHSGLDASTLEELERLGYTLDNRSFGDLHLITATVDGMDAASQSSGRGKAIVNPAQ
ncbi:gamma-glutamyltransferase [Alteromonas aestuariivivens]|uniref:Glutathione hydrolase proenzyme n=1 Tax=Alteromonas aestuariivivens TaxID=1938339 RepID=A0A3D8M9D7_9ALTE|nr:gamma-glutamyltransferase [Alteromonas aestuariivivens]RDV26637.1 gamma-glutamyltransferase [Alteromonas aestuariivivens]